jgi:single-strand DNA-binding protein
VRFNQMTLMGRLVESGVHSTFANGNHKIALRLAVDRDYVNEDGSRRADFVPAAIYGKLAENERLLGRLTKGSLVFVTGPLHINSKQRPDGSWAVYPEVAVDQIRVLSAPRGQAQSTDELADAEAAG